MGCLNSGNRFPQVQLCLHPRYILRRMTLEAGVRYLGFTEAECFLRNGYIVDLMAPCLEQGAVHNCGRPRTGFRPNWRDSVKMLGLDAGSPTETGAKNSAVDRP